MKAKMGEERRAMNCQQLAADGQTQLEKTVQAAHKILSSMNEELCNPSFWIPNSKDVSGGAGGGALEDARLSYKDAVNALRRVISHISSSQQTKPPDGDTTMGTENDGVQDEIKSLEKRAAELREEVTRKNGHLKVLIDQLRDLVSDISMWQSPAL